MEFFTTRHEEYGRLGCGRREATSGNLFSMPFLRKTKISHTPHRKSKYDAGQEIRPGTPQSCDVRGRKISKFATCKHGSYLGRDRENRVICRQSPSSAQGIKERWKKYVMTPIMPSLRGYSRTSKYLTSASSYVPNTRVSVWPYGLLR